LVNNKNEKEEIEFERNGKAVIYDWGKEIEGGESYNFRAFIKPLDVNSYYPRKGKGTIYLGNIEAMTIVNFVGESSNTGRMNYKKASIVYNSRNFSDIEFNPVVE
jgi:hypothetical protein